MSMSGPILRCLNIYSNRDRTSTEILQGYQEVFVCDKEDLETLFVDNQVDNPHVHFIDIEYLSYDFDANQIYGDIFFPNYFLFCIKDFRCTDQ